ncbi:MAG TPA: MFS transporter [Candidatus Bathyarchaeia archaeon]|nr:MFS transporter [Candidatus Bathyarchaeia archaeon]
MKQHYAVQLSTALSFGPTGIIWAFLPIHLRSLNASYLLISLISLIPAIETIGLSPFWGGILDKTGNGNRILIVSFLAEAVGFSIFPFLHDPDSFVIIVSLIGLFSSSFIPVYSALATHSNPQYGRAIGRFWVTASLGYASITLIGGILYQFISIDPLFLLGAAYAVAGCLIVLFAHSRDLSFAKTTENPLGYWGLLRQRNIAVLCLISVGVLISASAFNNFFTVYLVDVLNGSKLVAGLAATGTTVLGAIAYEYVGPLNDKIGRKPVFLLGAAGYVVYYTTLYFVSSILVVTILWTLPIYPFAQSASAALVSDYTSAADRGKGLGLLESALSFGGGLGPLAGGLIADASSLQAVILFSLTVALLSLVSSQVLLKNTKTSFNVSR